MNNFKKMISAFLAVTMVLCSNLPVMAAENVLRTADDESVMTREETLEFLGMTEEEAEGVSFYEFSESNPNGVLIAGRSVPGTIEDGVYSEDMSINNGFTGALHTCHGNRIKYAVRVDQLNGGQFTVTMNSGDRNLFASGQALITNNMYAGQTYQSGWWTIYYGAQIYFQYIYYNYTNTPAKFRIVVAVANI